MAHHLLPQVPHLQQDGGEGGDEHPLRIHLACAQEAGGLSDAPYVPAGLRGLTEVGQERLT
jgi:hypothetical protein